MSRETVSFWAKKPKRTKVSFTSRGRKVTFYAIQPKRTKIKFYAKRKRE